MGPLVTCYGDYLCVKQWLTRPEGGQARLSYSRSGIHGLHAHEAWPVRTAGSKRKWLTSGRQMSRAPLLFDAENRTQLPIPHVQVLTQVGFTPQSDPSCYLEFPTGIENLQTCAWPVIAAKISS